MKLSVNPKLIGKPTRHTAEDHRVVYMCGSNRINLGYGWQNIEAEWPDVFELITVDGYATSAELSSDRRAEETFVSRELIMVDVDSGMTIQELLNNDFYNEHAAGFYTTPSHTDEAHRFRIMFRLATPITDATRLQKLNKMLLRVFTQADAACKDATRIFYGTPGCVVKEQRDVVLSDSTVDAMISVYNDLEAAEMAQHSTVAHAPLNDWQRQRILDLLKTSFVGSYPVWRNIGWGLKRGGFTLADYQYVTAGMMNQKTPADAAQVWRSGSADGQVTMGTVIHFLKQRHGDDCLQQTEQDQLDTLYNSMESKLDMIRKKMKQWQLET